MKIAVLGLLGVFVLGGAFLEGRESLSDRAFELEKKVEASGGEVAFRGLEGWVFEEGISVKEGVKRVEEAEKIFDELELNRWRSVDLKRVEVFVGKVLGKFPGEWRAWNAAAAIHSELPSRGVLREAGFERKLSWDPGVYDLGFRDQVIEVRYLRKAMELGEKSFKEGKITGDLMARIYGRLAGKIEGLGRRDATVLTDLAILPKPEVFDYTWSRKRILRLDDSGKLLVPEFPKSFELARTDEERAYWCLRKACEVVEKNEVQARLELADFWRERLGVDEVARAGYYYIMGAGSEDDPEAPGEFELHTLKDEETLVIGPKGPQRVTLPERCRFVKMMQDLLKDEKTPEDDQWEIAEILIEDVFVDRRQFGRVAALAKEMGTRRETDSDGEEYTYDLIPWEFKNELVALGGGGRKLLSEEAEIELHSRSLNEVTLGLWKVDLGLLLEAKDFSENRIWLEGDDDFSYREGREDRELLEWFERFCVEVKTQKVEVQEKADFRQSHTKVSLGMMDVGHYLVVYRGKDGEMTFLPLQVYDLAIISGGRVVRDDDSSAFSYYVVDPNNGEALEGVELYPTRGKDGLPQYEVSDHTGRLNGVKAWGEGFLRRPGSRWQFVSWSVDREGYAISREDDLECFVVTNQPLYRPGQRVDFSGWLRLSPEWLGLRRVLKKGHPVRIRINDPTGRQVGVERMRLDEFGGFQGKCQLGDEVVLGQYEVKVDLGAEYSFEKGVLLENISWEELSKYALGSFEVGEFRKPDFQVTVEAVEGNGEFETVIVASYLSGEPVKNAAVTVNFAARPLMQRFYPKRKWDDQFWKGYEWGQPLPTHFEDWTKWAMWPVLEEYRSYQIFDQFDGYATATLDSFEGVTDEEGRLKLSMGRDLSMVERSGYEVRVGAVVTEYTGRKVEAEKWMMHTGRPFEVFARPSRGFYRLGEEIKVEVGMVTTAGESVAGDGVLKIERVTGDVFEEVLGKRVKVGEAGAEVVSLELAVAGQYRCLFEGGGSARGFLFEVIGEGGEPGRYGGVQIMARQTVMEAGESAELLIRTDEPEAVVWVFESHPHGLMRTPRQVKTRNHTAILRLPVLSSARPNFTLEALCFKDGKARTSRIGILIPDKESLLEVALLVDGKVKTPGEKAKVGVEVRNHRGEGTQAAVALTVYDRALEDLAGKLPSNSWLRVMFEDEGGAGTSLDEDRNFNDWRMVLREPGVFADWGQMLRPSVLGEGSRFISIHDGLWKQYDPPELPNTVGGGMSGGLGGGVAFPRTPATPTFSPLLAGRVELDARGAEMLKRSKVRKRFADRAYWGGSLRTGKDGKVEVDFELPENLTAWRVQSWAFGKGWSFGEAGTEILTAKKLQVRPMLPRAAVVGDELVVGAMVQNRSEEEDVFVLALEVAGAMVLDAGAREIQLAGGAEGVAYWRVRMEKAGAVVFQVKAAGRESDLSDGFEWRVPVMAKLVHTTSADAAVIRKGEKISELKLGFSDEMAGRTLLLRAEAEPAVSALKVLPDLVEYPYGCVEQTLSRFLPLMAAKQATDDLQLDWKDLMKVVGSRDGGLGWISGRAQMTVTTTSLDLNEEKVDDMIQSGLGRLAALQNEDGSWGWFSQDDPAARAYFTALAVRGLTLSKSLGRSLKKNDPTPGGVAWLERWSERAILAEAGEQRLVEMALAAWVLAEAGSKEAEARSNQLWEVRERLPLMGRLHLALALKDEERVSDLLKGIRTEMTNEVERRRSRRWWNEATEQRAYYLKLLLKTGADRKEVREEVRQLLEARRDGIRWKNTRESALCLEVIVAAMKSVMTDPFENGEPVELDLDVLGERRVLTLSQKDLWTAEVEVPVGAVEAEDLVVKVTRRGNEEVEVFLNASVSYLSGAPEVMVAAEEGLKLERRYYRVTREGVVLVKEGETFQKGEVIEVELEVLGEEGLEFLHLRDAIPAGFEPLVSSSGYAGGAYRESRTGEAHFFLTTLSDWNRTQRYRVSVVTEGKSLALPAAVECLYSPEVRGRSGAREVVSGE